MKIAVIVSVFVLTNAVANASGFFNVKDYGAVGNGSTDDTSAITSALAAANTNGGGAVYFPPGTYQVRPAVNNATDIEGGWAAFWVNTDNLTLVGDGPNVSKIILTNASPGSIAGSAVFWFGTQASVTNPPHANNLQVRGLNIDGGCTDTANQSSTAGYTLLDFATCTNILVDNCWLMNSQEHAIDMEYLYSQGLLVNNCIVSNHASAGLHGEGGAGSIFRVRNSRIYRSGMTTFNVSWTNFVSTRTSSGVSAGIDNQNGAVLDVDGCYFEGSPMNMSACYGNVRNCTFVGSATSSNLLVVGGGSISLTFANNHFENSAFLTYDTQVLKSGYLVSNLRMEGNYFTAGSVAVGWSSDTFSSTEIARFGNNYFAHANLFLMAATNVTVADNLFCDSGNLAFYSDLVRSNYVIGNVFVPPTAGAMTFLHFNTASEYGNVFKHNLFKAPCTVDVGSWNNTFLDNWIEGTFSLSDVRGTTVEGNTIGNLKIVGSDSASGNTFKKNTISTLDAGTDSTLLKSINFENNSGAGLGMLIGSTTNSMAAWPAAAVNPGGYAIVTSNNVVYLLTSTPASTAWGATNRLGP
ncbi:MAG TPA: glycosyl hydrolase family 28-related protein [Candidatus Binatia bacterium]|jgi:hypothetical protein|nr:glycosyl hydrolase family 28-related protein [Candidatus Binatia bacterium]